MPQQKPYSPAPTTIGLENLLARELKDKLLPMLGGGSKASEDTRVSQQTLSDYGNTSHSASITMAVLIDLFTALAALKADEGADMPHPVPLLSVFAQHFGYDVVRLADPSRPESWLAAIGDLSRDYTGIIQAITQSLEDDNRVTGDEVIKHKMAATLTNLISQASGLLMQVNNISASREAAIAGRPAS